MTNESIGLMIMQTFRHRYSSSRSFHLRRIYHFSLLFTRFDDYLVLMKLLIQWLFSFEGIVNFDEIINIVYNLLSDVSARWVGL